MFFSKSLIMNLSKGCVGVFYFTNWKCAVIIGAAGGTRGRSSRLFSAGGKLPSACHQLSDVSSPEQPGLTSSVASGLSLFGTIFVEMVW